MTNEPTMAPITDLKKGDIFYVEGHAFRFDALEDGGDRVFVDTAAGTTFMFDHNDWVRAIQYNVKPKE
jgi:hypothetical protein